MINSDNCFHAEESMTFMLIWKNVPLIFSQLAATDSTHVTSDDQGQS
jgi:hypothetical protein